MRPPLEAESTLTDRDQTTVPDTVRRALKLGKRDKIRYAILPNGEVVLSRVEPNEAHDPLLGQFLNFVARDIAAHPSRLQGFDAGLVERAQALVSGVDLDPDEELRPEDE
jgi:antitoxin PrlF